MTILRATIEISSADLGGTGTNTWHVESTGVLPGSLAGADDMMGELETFYTAIAPLFHSDTDLTFDGELQGVGPDQGVLASGTPWATIGSASGASLPPATCLVVGWRTGAGGRMGKGRTFLGPLTDVALNSDGKPTATAVTDTQTAADALVAASIAHADAHLGVWSGGRVGHETLPPADPEFRPFLSAHIRTIFASLRSRRD